MTEKFSSFTAPAWALVDVQTGNVMTTNVGSMGIFNTRVVADHVAKEHNELGIQVEVVEIRITRAGLQ